MADHTPGPWRMGSPSQFGVHNPNIVQTTDGEGIASVLGMPIHTKLEEIGARWAEGVANARLIAVAPEMYDYIASCASNGCAEAKRLIATAQGGRNG